MQKIEIIKNELSEYFRQFEDLDLKFYIDEGDEVKEILEFCTENKADDVEELCKQLISFIYDEEINWRNKIVRGFKTFCNRKIVQLDKYMRTENTEKVEEINRDMIKQYKIVQEQKSEVQFYKMFVSALYYVRNNAEYLEKQVG
ncbi:hypothetical protein [Inediibacterium massiliense]|uniref:hypothetical protein n=1 Tax=Inediibacterium massiliense TaxID=1658111 RepID=UPI0006B55BB2|nr:hypothetical protein [Inediibacterium massiliense]